MRAAEWSGGVGETWAAEWRRTDRSFAGLDDALTRAILAAAPAAGGRWVDLGCGAGRTSLAITAARPDVEVIGVDLSADLIAVAEARRNEGGVAPERCRFVAGDATDAVAALAPIDLFFSRHGVMFFDDPVAAFTQFATAAAPGAGLVFSCFAGPADNKWATETVAAAPAPREGEPEPGPFAFADPDRVATILAAAGWDVPRPPERVDFRYVAGAGGDPVSDAVDFFSSIGPAASGLKDASASDRPAVLARIGEACRRHREGNEVAFPAAAWLWSARAKESPR